MELTLRWTASTQDTDQDFILQLNVKLLLLLFLSFILLLAWKDKASICTSQATDKGVTFQTAGFVIKDFNLSTMLQTPEALPMASSSIPNVTTSYD